MNILTSKSSFLNDDLIFEEFGNINSSSQSNEEPTEKVLTKTKE